MSSSKRPRAAGAWGLRLMGTLLLAVVAGSNLSCECEDDCACTRPDTTPPAAPRGLYSTTGNGQITLAWLANTEADLEGYEIWWSDAYAGEYEYIATIAPSGEYDERFVDSGAVNREIYYYAVTAFDRAGNSSDLSYEEVWDTARPSGFGVTLANACDTADGAGFDFSPAGIVSALDPAADFHYQWRGTGEAFLVTEHLEGSGMRVVAQDMGITSDFDEISFAPETGYSPSGVLEAIEGHTYVFLTQEGGSGYYAKIRLGTMGSGHLNFDWAFQAVPGNIQLNVR